MQVKWKIPLNGPCFQTTFSYDYGSRGLIVFRWFFFFFFCKVIYKILRLLVILVKPGLLRIEIFFEIFWKEVSVVWCNYQPVTEAFSYLFEQYPLSAKISMLMINASMFLFISVDSDLPRFSSILSGLAFAFRN